MKQMVPASENRMAGPAFCSGVLDVPMVERLKTNPRAGFIDAVRKNDAATCLVKTAEIHGHYCPGSALGVMASLYGLGLLGINAGDSDGVMENLLAIVEINACFADGIQAVSGCTLGNNALIYRDIGKLAVTFAVRGNEEGIRVMVRPEFARHIAEAVPEFYPLMEKVILKRSGTPDDLKHFRKTGRDAAFALISLPFDVLFEARAVVPDIPPYAPIADTGICPECNEPVMTSKIRRHGSRKGTCLMCSGGYFEVEGRGIVRRNTGTTIIGANGRSYRDG
jgi:formylmethanofuran dehydrogenase subunit E